MTPYIPLRFIGEDKLTSLVVENVETKEQLTIEVNATFEYVGANANTSFIKDKEILDEKGYIIVNSKMETAVKGIYAAGDVTVKELRQIVTASNDGAIAAINVNSYLKK